MNIKFSYLYRDAANYKNYGEVIFSNPSQLSLDQIEQLIRSKLIEGQWFVAKDWGLPDLHFENWDNELDHGWHEFERVTLTEEDTTLAKDYFDAFVLKVVMPLVIRQELG